MGIGGEVTGSDALDPLPLTYEPRRIRRRWSWPRELWAWIVELRGFIQIAVVVALILVAITLVVGVIASNFFPGNFQFRLK